jgi:hypothetical protein
MSNTYINTVDLFDPKEYLDNDNPQAYCWYAGVTRDPYNDNEE